MGQSSLKAKELGMSW